MSEWVMSARPTEHVPCTSCKCCRLHQSIILRQLSQGWGLLLTHRAPGRVCQGLVMSGGAVFDLFRWLLHHVGVERSKLSSSEWSSGKGWSRQGVMGDANGVPHSQTPPEQCQGAMNFGVQFGKNLSSAREIKSLQQGILRMTPVKSSILFFYAL